MRKMRQNSPEETPVHSPEVPEPSSSLFPEIDPDAPVHQLKNVLSQASNSMWTAFILYRHSLFARGLERLLEQQEGVIVTGVQAMGHEAFAHIRRLKPDVIIVETERGESEPETLLSQFLREQASAKMVCLNLQDNTAILYAGCRCMANSVEDLLRCVLTSLMREP
jgi:hypothetical protein